MLRENDSPAEHRWLRSVRARRTLCDGENSPESWAWLHARTNEGERMRQGAHRAVSAALAYDSPRGRRYLNEAVAVAQAAESCGVDHLHAHFANHPTFVTLLVHHITGLPFSFTAHAKDIYARGPSRELVRRQLKSSEFAVTVSEANRLHFVDELGRAEASKMRRLYNGVDLEMIRPRDTTLPANAVPKILTVARLVEKKGIGRLLDAAAILKRQGRRFHCSVVGDGPDAERLKRRRSELGVDEEVELVGALPHEEVVARMAAADVFVLPAIVAADGDQDALPTVLLEAMASGLPSISTPVGGIPEIITSGMTGLVVASHERSALANAIATLLENDEQRKRMGLLARCRAEQKFDRRRNVAALNSWFEAARTSSHHVRRESHSFALGA